MKLTFKSLFLPGLIAVISLMLFTGCGRDTGSGETDRTSLKPQMELVKEIPLGNVAEDKIPDVTKDRWSYGVPFTKPVVFPDGRHVLAVEEGKMTLFDTAAGTQKWSKPTYGGIDTYAAGAGRLYMSEKGSSKSMKEHGYVICVDAKSGDEIWKYDVQPDLAPVVEKHMPPDAKLSLSCYIKIALFGEKLVVKGHTSWAVGKDSDKAEVLLCLDRDGKLLWKVESHGYPGISAHSKFQIIGNKLVMGTYSYDDDLNGPTYLHAFDLDTGKKLWQFDIKHEDELAYSKATDVAAAVVGDKVVGVTNYGRVYVLDQDGRKISEFVAFEPLKYGDNVICTNVWGDKVAGFGENGLIIAPSKSVLKGTTNYQAKTPVEHPDAGSVKVFDLSGNLKWKFRLGGEAAALSVKNNYLILGTSHNQNTLDYGYCGVYAFNLARRGEGGEVDVTQETALEKYIGYYHTAGAVLWGCMDTSDDNKVICATTWPTRVGTEKHGGHSLYILKLK